MKVTYTEEAVADIVEAITYLNERNPTAAAKLDADIALCIERLADREFEGPVSRLRSGAAVRTGHRRRDRRGHRPRSRDLSDVGEARLWRDTRAYPSRGPGWPTAAGPVERRCQRGTVAITRDIRGGRDHRPCR